MSGGLYLTTANPELAHCYDLEKEIVCYDNEEDAACRIRWLLANPERAEEIRCAGHARALKDHTWNVRFEKVFTVLGVL